MGKKRYESPEFRFQELFLFEGVADVCWGYHQADLYIFYDADHDDTYDTGETVIFQHHFVPSEGGNGNGCSNIDDAMQNYMPQIEAAFYAAGYGKYWTAEVRNKIVTHENAGSSSSMYIPVHS